MIAWIPTRWRTSIRISNTCNIASLGLGPHGVSVRWFFFYPPSCLGRFRLCRLPLLCYDVIPQSFQHRFFFCRQRKAEKRRSAVGPSTRRISRAASWSAADIGTKACLCRVRKWDLLLTPGQKLDSLSERTRTRIASGIPLVDSRTCTSLTTPGGAAMIYAPAGSCPDWPVNMSGNGEYRIKSDAEVYCSALRIPLTCKHGLVAQE
ncbi:hypothetical protein CI102_5218 [Trichoderma harzianum]|nr:hypothetical protein CI102_5218 [Trichoderma harzianum]